MLGRSVTLNFFLVPAERVNDFLVKRTLVAFGLTLTLQVRVVTLFKKRNPFSLILTVMVVFPTASPTASQLALSVDSMETVEVSSLLNVTSSSVTPSTVRVKLSSTNTSVEVTSREYLDVEAACLFLAAQAYVLLHSSAGNSKTSMMHIIFPRLIINSIL
jgi:hypothetical protein